MDWIKRLNQAIDFIEENLDGELDYEEVAGIAGCPSYYFQQMFLYMTDMTLREYIRRRRLSLSAVELQKGNGKVTDIAMKYGYESPTAFTRAFKNFHGITPSAVKTEPVSFQAYPPISFSMAIHGGAPLQFRIEEKEAFRILGRSCPLSKELTENFQRIPAVWDAALADGTLARLLSMAEGKPEGLLGVSIHHTEDWKYLIAVRSDQKPGEYEEYQIPACKWAVFKERERTVPFRNWKGVSLPSGSLRPATPTQRYRILRCISMQTRKTQSMNTGFLYDKKGMEPEGGYRWIARR